MENLKTKSVLIADNGLFTELAPRLARDFGEVKLFVPWTSAYPKAGYAFIGTGIKDVERVQTFWDHVKDADLVVFPDLHFSDVQLVVSQRFNKPVWGHRKAESLELDRWGMQSLRRKLGLETSVVRRFTGVTKLAAYLKNVEDKWIKLSTYSGDSRTWYHDSWHTTALYLDYFRNCVGPLADEYEFIVEDHTDGANVCYDGFTVNGEWPEASYWGLELDESAYIGKFSPYSELPKPILDINSSISSILKEESAVGFCSLINCCMKARLPSFEAAMEGYENLAEIIWEGAHGRVAPVRSTGEFIAAATIHRRLHPSISWIPLGIPDSIRQWVKIRNLTVVNDVIDSTVTNATVSEVGSVVAVADSQEEAIELVKERAAKVYGHMLRINTDALDSADKEIEKAKEFGVDF